MLTNLLPGIRDIRTPLATGYLWLLTLWLWIPSHFKHVPPTTGVPGDITRLAHYASRAGVGIAISFLAYLIGVLSKSLNPPLVRVGTFNAYVPEFIRLGIFWTWVAISPYREFGSGSPNVRFIDFWRRITDTPPRHQSWRQSEEEREKREEIELKYAQKVDVVTGVLSWKGMTSLDAASQRAADEGIIHKEAQAKYHTYLLREVPRLGNALVGKEPELYSVYDRLISEYEFRTGISAPLIALIITLAARWSLFWLLILLPVMVLLAAGSQQRMAAGDLLADAVRLKRIDVALPRELALTSANGDDSGSGNKTLDPNANQT